MRDLNVTAKRKSAPLTNSHDTAIEPAL